MVTLNFDSTSQVLKIQAAHENVNLFLFLLASRDRICLSLLNTEILSMHRHAHDTLIVMPYTFSSEYYSESI